MSRGNKRDITTILHQLSFSDFKFLILSGKIRHRLAPETHIDRSFTFKDGFLGGDFGLGGIARRDDGHVGQHTHSRDVLQSLMRGAIGTYGNTSMGTTDDDMHIVVTHRDTNLVVGTVRRKHTVGAKDGNLTT